VGDDAPPAHSGNLDPPTGAENFADDEEFENFGLNMQDNQLSNTEVPIFQGTIPSGKDITDPIESDDEETELFTPGHFGLDPGEVPVTVRRPKIKGLTEDQKWVQEKKLDPRFAEYFKVTE
jgi:hypothetical protein